MFQEKVKCRSEEEKLQVRRNSTTAEDNCRSDKVKLQERTIAGQKEDRCKSE